MGIITSQPSLRQEVKERCHQLPIWDFVVKRIRDTKQWRLLIDEIFHDEIYNTPRLEVVDIITEEIIQTLTEKNKREHADKISNSYQSWRHQIFKKHTIDSVDTTVERLTKKIVELEQEFDLVNRQLQSFQKTHMEHLRYVSEWSRASHRRQYHAARGMDETD